MSEPSLLGLQQERTTLAWRRTALSLFVVALVISRFALKDHASAFVVAALAVAVATFGAALSSLRLHHWSAPSRIEPVFGLLLRDGRLPALLVLVAASLCLVELALAFGVLS